MERFEDFARHKRTAETRARVLAELETRLEGGLTPHPRLEGLAARLRAHRTTLMPVPEVTCVALYSKNAPPGGVFDGPVIGISGKLVDTASNAHLAFVLAHELAHVALGHIDERRLAHPRLSALRLALKSVTYMREQRELDADRLAYRWLADAGLESGAWECFHALRRRYEKAGHWAAIRSVEIESPLVSWLYRYLRTHPSVDERLWQLRVLDPYGEGRAEDVLRTRKRRRKRKRKRKRKR